MKDETEEMGQRLNCCPEDEEWKKGENSKIGCFCFVTTLLLAEFTEVPPRENVQWSEYEEEDILYDILEGVKSVH